MKLKTKLCSSLAKIMPATAPSGKEFRSGSSLGGEVYSFQLAYCPVDFQRFELDLSIESPLKEFIRCRKVELVPVNYPGQLFDDDYLSTVPGLYPDRLEELSADRPIRAQLGQWRSLWFTVRIPQGQPAGKYDIKITLAVNDKESKKHITSSKTFSLEVLPFNLPPQQLSFTNWFHADCLAVYYGCKIFSEEHWHILEKFFRSAVSHGMTLLLTPIFTLPLDTGIGKERPTCQLVKVQCDKGIYSFDFSLFDRWVALALDCGIKEFEMSHLFTQWGAEYTPKIMATVDGVEKRIAGWNLRSDSPEYQTFLDAFLPALTTHLKELGLQDKVFFHCSDEPADKHFKSYRHAAALLHKYVKGFRTMDALSDVKFYKLGYTTHPVPLEAHVDPFIAADVPELWTYYCCGPADIYPNRFITMPSSRNRVLGSLLYYYNVKGFLHWGFNFYFSQYSAYPIDPYRTTDADGGFPGGDPFIVYPGKGGIPEDSLRHEVFFEALQDQRALQLLEHFIPRSKIMSMLDKFVPDGKMSMANYPKGEAAVLAVRKKINALLKKFATC